MISPILCIGQSDSSAGTGIQADIKTAQALGGYVASVITAVTAQNRKDLYEMYPLPPSLVRAQIEKVMEDLNPLTIKTGMLVDTAIIDMVGDFLDERDEGYDTLNVIIDPVMTHRNGEMFLDKNGRDALKRRLLIHADILLPNIVEAEELTGMKIPDVETACQAAEILHTLGAKTVILKCGMLSTEINYDVVSDENDTHILQSRRIEMKPTYGAGNALSSAIAVGISQGKSPLEAFKFARSYLNQGMENAVMVGGSYGIFNHRPDKKTVQSAAA